MVDRAKVDGRGGVEGAGRRAPGRLDPQARQEAALGGDRERQELLGGPAAAVLHRARHPVQDADPRAGRGDGGHRPADRPAHPEHAQGELQGDDRADHRAPPQHGDGVRQDSSHGRRQGGRVRAAYRPPQARRRPLHQSAAPDRTGLVRQAQAHRRGLRHQEGLQPRQDRRV